MIFNILHIYQEVTTHEKKMRLIVSLLSIIAIFVLAACGNKENNSTDNSKESKKGNEASYTVEHAMGKTTIKGTPKRVVILTNEGTEALLAMGVTPVGAVKSWTGDPWYKHISDQLKILKLSELKAK